MNSELLACIHAAEFPAQALLRLRTDLSAEPVAVLEGRAPLERVCSMNAHARQKGVALGMTRLEAEAVTGLRLLARSVDEETFARAVFLECAANFSPRIEEASAANSCAFVLDIAGTERLFGPPASFAERLRAAVARAGFRTSVAVSSNFDTARLKAASARGIAVVPTGGEATALARLPIASLDIAVEHLHTFELWGIRTLGELAALPELDLITRMGQVGRLWRERARGQSPHTFQPIETEFTLSEFCEFETEVEEVDSLLFVAARMIDCLVERAAARAMSLASLEVRMVLAAGEAYSRTIRPALPTVDRKFLLKLLQLEIAAYPPSAAVKALTLSAGAGQSRKVQMGLFEPQTPEPARLDITIARLKAMVGDNRVGSAVLEDTQRADGFRMGSFTLANRPETSKPRLQRMAVRRMRPSHMVRVETSAHRPALIQDGTRSYRVTSAFGPWRSHGCWWASEEWDRDEWDVLAQAPDQSDIACLIVFDRTRKQWLLEALYD